MTPQEAIEILSKINIAVEVGATPILLKSQILEATTMAIKALEQQSCDVAEQGQPCEDSIRELIREFDNKHPALFADYMQEFNNHPISEIIEYMWDMHDLIEDIKYRLPNKGGEEE